MEFGRHYMPETRYLNAIVVRSKDVSNNEIPLRTASIRNSLIGRKGFIYCSCLTKYTTNRCKCKKNNIFFVI